MAITKLRDTFQQQKLAENKFAGLIKSHMQTYGIDICETAAALCIGKTTLYERLRNPLELRLGDLQRLRNKLHISNEDLCAALSAIIMQKGGTA